MVDIEKVIKGLECCKNRYDCKQCPYEKEYDPILDCVDKTRADAIELLNEYKEHEELLNKLGYHWTGNGETLALCRKSRVGKQE